MIHIYECWFALDNQIITVYLWVSETCMYNKGCLEKKSLCALKNVSKML